MPGCPPPPPVEKSHDLVVVHTALQAENPIGKRHLRWQGWERFWLEILLPVEEDDSGPEEGMDEQTPPRATSYIQQLP